VLTVTTRSELVKALWSCASEERKPQTRRLLAGLSKDELQYIAEFLGSSILENHFRGWSTRWELAEGITCFERRRQRSDGSMATNSEHKMIVLLEFLCSCA